MKNQNPEELKKSQKMEFPQKENDFSGKMPDGKNEYIYPPFSDQLASKMFNSFQKLPEYLDQRNNISGLRSRNLAENLYSLENLRNSYEQYFSEKYKRSVEQDPVLQKRVIQEEPWGAAERKKYEEGMTEHLEAQSIRMQILKTKKEELDLIIRRLRVDIKVDLDRLREYQLSKFQFRDRISKIEKAMRCKANWFREPGFDNRLAVTDMYQEALPQSNGLFHPTNPMLAKRSDQEFFMKG